MKFRKIRRDEMWIRTGGDRPSLVNKIRYGMREERKAINEQDHGKQKEWSQDK